MIKEAQTRQNINWTWFQPPKAKDTKNGGSHTWYTNALLVVKCEVLGRDSNEVLLRLRHPGGDETVVNTTT